MNKIKQLMAILSFVPALGMAQTTTENYVHTQTMLDGTGKNFIESVQYYNGLGYPTVAVSTVGTNGQTAATLTTYDALGREDRKYLPVPCSNLDIVNEAHFKSQAMFYMDNSAFTQNHYDALDRVKAVDIAGDKWRRAGKQNRTEYLTNTDEDRLKDKVQHYVANPNGKNSLMRPDDANNPFRFYPAGSLTKEIQEDADGKTVITFKDLMGNVILQRANDGWNNLDTYYVYDAIGQLCYVLTPQYQKVSNKAINAYEYRYDDRGRIYKKILPGCEYIQYWYDNADRVIAMQDGTLRKDGKFRLYMYDKLGRMVVQLLYTNWNYNSTFFKDNCAVTTFTNNSGFLGTGYSMISQLASQPSNASLEIVNYYDSYDFNGKLFTSAMPANITVSDYQKQYSIGSLTGTVVYATNGDALGTINVYDQKGQVVRSVRKGLGGFVEDVNNAYNTITGAVDKTMANVNMKYGPDFVATTNYTYNHGKKTKMKLSITHNDSNTKARETEYVYDTIGRLTNKNRQLRGTYYSSCSYTYDVHGWLTNINSGDFLEELHYADSVDNGPKYYNGNISAYKWKKRNGNDYHGYIFKYDGNNRLSEAAYGWGNNLSSAKNYFSEYVDEYDYNGNIKRLRRRGNTGHGFGYVDDLYMTYSGNKLTSVRDNAIHDAYDGANDFYTESKEKEYPLTYNYAGSLESDAGRNIAYIRYDYNNNPTLIVFKDGHETEYVYSATGEKLRVVYTTAMPRVIKREIGKDITERLPEKYMVSTPETVDYLLGGALTLRNGRIDKYQFEEGYCQAIPVSNPDPMEIVFSFEDIEVDPDEVPMPIADNFEFYYYDRDHLGNIRQVTKDTGWSKGDVVQTMDYYPFGAEFCDYNTKNFVQNHKYNGKEFDHMHGLNTYDYGARQYNPVTARWDRMDPLCEKFYSTSPYAYCRNNPVIRIDVDGLYDTNGIQNGGEYPLVAVFQNKDVINNDEFLKEAHENALTNNIPIIYADDTNDCADAFSELNIQGNKNVVFVCHGTTPQDAEGRNHEDGTYFNIGKDEIHSGADMGKLNTALNGKNVGIVACDVGNNRDLITSVAKETQSNVIGSQNLIHSNANIFSGRPVLHWSNKQLDAFSLSTKGNNCVNVYDLTISRTGIGYTR